MKTSISALLKSAWIGVFAVLAVSCSPETEHTEPAMTPSDIVSPSPVATVTGADYSNMDHWLCHADKENDACSGETTVSIVGPNSVSRKTIEAAESPEYDCFYIYPTNLTGRHAQLRPDARPLRGALCRPPAAAFVQGPMPPICADVPPADTSRAQPLHDDGRTDWRHVGAVSRCEKRLGTLSGAP